MNIFAVQEEPRAAALDLCDKHVVRMTLESMQMICTIAHQYNMPIDIPYKSTHVKHPCTIWAGSSIQNFAWLLEHFYALSSEYSKRYGKIHKCATYVEFFKGIVQHLYRLPNIGLTNFALAMPEQYKTADAVESYRNYYVGEKANFAVWTGRTPPDWFQTKLANLKT